MSAATDLVRVTLTLMNDTYISCYIQLSFQTDFTFFFVHSGFEKPFLLQNVVEQPHIATHVFCLTTFISIHAVGDKLISKTLIQIKG